MDALILAAGRGTRMRGLCDATPKPMLPVANLPVLEYVFGGLTQAGVDHAWVVVGHLGDEIRRHFAQHPPAKLKVDFIEQITPNGTGSAALLGKGRVRPAPFLLLFADILVPQAEYAGVVADFREAGCDAILSVRRVPDPCFGAAVYVEKGRITRILEKPPRGTSITPFDSAGLFLMPPTLFNYLERVGLSPRGEYEMTDAIAAMIADGISYGIHEIAGFWYNLTDPEALVAANAHAIESLGETVIVSPKLEVRQPTAIDRTSRCGKCHLGPNVSVGADCVVGDGARLENTILMPGARVGDGAQVRWAILGPGARVEPGASHIGAADQVLVVK